MGGTLLAALARPTTSRQLAGAHGSDRGEPAVALFRLLVDAGLLTAVGSDGRTDEDADPSIRTWSFHDLLFHARSRAGRHDDPMGGHYPFAGELEPPPATRPLPPGPTIRLAVPDLDAVIRSDPPFTTVLERRRSIRTYGTSPITVHQVGEFLYRCARVRRCIPQGDGDPYPSTDRPYPSAGGAHDLEVYVAVHRCVELAAGVYGYDPLRHALTPIAGSDERLDALLEHARASAVAPEPPQVLLVVTSRFARLSWKYLGVAYANTQKNVGVLLQTMYLVATAMGLAGCAVGNGDTAVFADLVGTDYFTESSVGEFMLGSLPGAVGSSRDSAYDRAHGRAGGNQSAGGRCCGRRCRGERRPRRGRRRVPPGAGRVRRAPLRGGSPPLARRGRDGVWQGPVMGRGRPRLRDESGQRPAALRYGAVGLARIAHCTVSGGSADTVTSGPGARPLPGTTHHHDSTIKSWRP